MINAEITTAGKLMAILTAPGELQAVIAQGPMIVNDYVFQVLESETEYIFQVRRGSEVQSITFPKEGGSGNDGVGIESVEQTTTSTVDGGTNIITVTKTDGTSSTFRVQNGSKGSKGDPGYTPQKGIDYFDGQPGAPGSDGQPGKDGYTPVKGKDYFDGKDGNPGKDGVSPTVAINSIAGGHRISITDASGTKTADVMDGAMGEPGYTPVKGKDYFDGSPGRDGADGSDGFSPTVAVSNITGGHRIAITDKNGTKNVDVMDGSAGADGQRGTGILKITTAPSSYTTATGGFTPTYRVALSTVLSQAKVDEVLVGDTVAYNYYQYPVGYVDASYVYLGARTSVRGAAGAAGTTPVKGTDYYTEADKTEMVGLVKAALPTVTLTGTDADNVVHTWTLYGVAAT